MMDDPERLSQPTLTKRTGSSGPRLRDLISSYLKKNSVPPSTLSNLQAWDDDLGKIYFSDLTPKMVRSRIEERGKTRAVATVNRELAVLKRVINWAMNEEELVRDNPLTKVSYQPGAVVRDRWLTQEEEAQLLKHCQVWLAALIQFALNTGLRRSEMLNLDWEHVYPDRGYLVVNKSKNGKKRNIPLNSTALAVLTLAGIGESGLVFKGITANMLEYAFHCAVNRARINDRFTWHCLRHTFCTRLVQNGVDLYRVQVLAGHSSFDITKKYAHHSVNSLKSAVEVLL